MFVRFDSTLIGSDTLVFSYWALKPSFLIRVRSTLLSTAIHTPTVEISHDSTGSSSLADRSASWGSDTAGGQGVNDFSITGSKRVIVSGSSFGGNKLSQELDLTMRGHLSEHVQVEGHLSDKGRSLPVSPYDAATSSENVARLNSALSELDRVNLAIKGPDFGLEIGDLSTERSQTKMWLGPDAPATELEPLHALFGVTSRWNTRTHSVSGTIARPRGSRTTVELSGRDNIQGPYRISDRPGGSAIVPGSEQVWLDGIRLARGVSFDYEMDYTVGTITFAPQRPIDSRRRIVVSFESTTDEYRREFLSTSGDFATTDSTLLLTIQIQREQDNADRPLSDSSLFNKNDFVSLADGELIRSGILPDSAGDYALVADSLPDTVLVYVGSGLGAYRLRTTFVGSGKGSYRYFGSGRYQFAGPGNGDYLPIIVLTAPARLDLLLFGGAIHPVRGLHSGIEFRQSTENKNLLSLDHSQQYSGRAYGLSFGTDSQIVRLVTLNGSFRYQDAAYAGPEHFLPTDLARRFLLPHDSLPSGDRALAGSEMSINPLSGIDIRGKLGEYSHRGLFSAQESSLQAQLGDQSTLATVLGYRAVDASSHLQGSAGDGALHEETIRLAAWPRGLVSSTLLLQQERRRTSYDLQRVNNRERMAELSSTIRGIGSMTISANRIDSAASSQLLKRETWRSFVQTAWHSEHISTEASFGWQSIENNVSSAQAAIAYTRVAGTQLPSGLNWSVDYRLGNELSSARGYSFLEVPAGEGEFRREDSSYIPDPNGNFIRIEEILSDSAIVSKGEKHGQLDWKSSIVSIHAGTSLLERRTDKKSRSLFWVFPWYSRKSDSFQSLSQSTDVRVDLFEQDRAQPLTFAWSEDRDLRNGGFSPEVRRDWQWSITARGMNARQSAELLFEHFGNFRTGAFGVSGDIRGSRVQLMTRLINRMVMPSAGLEYRQASETELSRLTQWRLLTGLRIQSDPKSQLRYDGNASGEFYHNRLTSAADTQSLLLSGNRRGTNGGVVGINGSVTDKSGLSVRISLSANISDGFKPIISGRSEVAVGF